MRVPCSPDAAATLSKKLQGVCATEVLHGSEALCQIAALQDESEARLRELHADIATTWKERRELLDDVRGIATRLEQAASRAAARVPPESPEEADEPVAEPPELVIRDRSSE